MVALTAAAAFVKGWSDFKKYSHKMDMCRFAYTTYEKTLIELRKDARAHEFDINPFLIKMQTLDELVTDFAPPVFERYKQVFEIKGSYHHMLLSLLSSVYFIGDFCKASYGRPMQNEEM